MATLRNTAIELLRAAGFDNIAKAHRHMTHDENRPLRLLQTSEKQGLICDYLHSCSR